MVLEASSSTILGEGGSSGEVKRADFPGASWKQDMGRGSAAWQDGDAHAPSRSQEKVYARSETVVRHVMRQPNPGHRPLLGLQHRPGAAVWAHPQAPCTPGLGRHAHLPVLLLTQIPAGLSAATAVVARWPALHPSCFPAVVARWPALHPSCFPAVVARWPALHPSCFPAVWIGCSTCGHCTRIGYVVSWPPLPLLMWGAARGRCPPLPTTASPASCLIAPGVFPCTCACPCPCRELPEGGAPLSAGQKQLLALARALLNPAKVLVLGEWVKGGG